MTVGVSPTDFGDNYTLGQLNTDTFSYGPSFLIRVNYNVPLFTNLSFFLSGAQPTYELAWRTAPAGLDQSFDNALGASIINLVGLGNGLYYTQPGVLVPLPALATRYQIGAKATSGSYQDLDTQLTLTVLVN